MTENYANRELSTQEEYTRSGHTGSDMTQNADGYFESSPALNAPPGRAMAAYDDPHAECWPYTIACLGKTDIAVSSKHRLISKLFVIDAIEMQLGGELEEFTLTCSAQLIGAYIPLLKDLGPNAGWYVLPDSFVQFD